MVLDEGDKGPDALFASVPDTIISYAIWARGGTSKAARYQWNKKDTWTNILDSEYCQIRISTRQMTAWNWCIIGLNSQVTAWSVSRKCSRRDADPLRLKHLDEATKVAEKQYLSGFPEKWTMELLVTDILFRRCGAASALIAWGTAMADNEGLVCKVEASWMGVIVYKSAGFKVLSDWTVQVPGQKEKLQYWIMLREPSFKRWNDRVFTQGHSEKWCYPSRLRFPGLSCQLVDHICDREYMNWSKSSILEGNDWVYRCRCFTDTPLTIAYGFLTIIIVVSAEVMHQQFPYLELFNSGYLARVGASNSGDQYYNFWNVSKCVIPRWKIESHIVAPDGTSVRLPLDTDLMLGL